VSVVLSVRNGSPFLANAIESVLGQSFADFELIIVDDASTDDTAELLRVYHRRDSRVRILTNPRNLGPYPSTNRALALARADLIARHDADDVSPPHRLAIQVDAARSNEGVSLVLGDVEQFGEAGGRSWIHHAPGWQPRLEWELLFSNAVGAGAHVLFPRRIHDNPVFFSERRRYAEDYELWVRLSRLGRVVSPAGVVYRYRRHGESISSSYRAEQRQCFEDIRFAHVSGLLGAAVSRDMLDETARLWNMEKQDSPPSMREGWTLLDRIKREFLPYVARRFGAAAAESFDDQIARALDDRLSFWLLRALRRGDPSSGWRILSTAHRRGRASRVGRRAMVLLGSAAVRRVRAVGPSHAAGR
jgi:glycosyltransferase involved in cell wall biosynthesis